VTSPHVAIVVLTHNQRDMTLDCLHHVFAMAGRPFDVVVWDNGSHDDTIAAVREQFPSVTSHYCAENLGVASGRNAAARLAIEEHAPELSYCVVETDAA
jgi:GT2 family glycosyltransferase